MIKLKDFTLKSVKQFRGREGNGFNADLWCQGKKVAFACDDASGGEMQIEWIGQTRFTPPDFMKAFLMSPEALKIGNERERAFRKRMPELYKNESMPSRWCEADFIEYLLEQFELDKMAKKHGFVFAPATDPATLTGYNVPKGTKWTKALLDTLKKRAVKECGEIIVLREPVLA